ncbi:hypothetical protein L484_001385 [Morus notabilis]|uniref:NAD(P)H-quinone oxidoreductase subunit S n=1 Tax=Morus notabilis TaxID=981085 RepID=W9R432_9ROSA|nr:NAD(P)H-quinone oxidoreductase subunit S, chloroplastic [Morus notabilis]EXB54047.1 hypothetical protein L484_001385 [Morus notabilis]
MASSNITLPSFKSYFLSGKHLSNRPIKPSFTTYKPQSPQSLRPCAKFDLFKILGGRGLCNGEEGLQQELSRNVDERASEVAYKEQENPDSPAIPTVESVPEESFEKELMGLTGGFPGGEKGLQLFIEKNPPPEKPSAGKATQLINLKKPKAPELPLLLPGMIAIVSNPNSPYYMYTGIVQRITDGKAGVLFEGGNWDRLTTFRIDELQRREKGPPGKNPQSAVLEPLLKKDSE